MTRPKGGVGSNQYQTKPGSTPRRREIPTATLVDDNDSEKVAWMFHPDRHLWRGIPDDEAWNWVQAGIGYDTALNWKVAGFDWTMASPWVAHGYRGINDIVGHYRTIVYEKVADPKPGGATAVTTVHLNAAVRRFPQGDVHLLGPQGNAVSMYQPGGSRTVVADVYLDPFITEVPLPPLTATETGLWLAVADGYPQHRNRWSDLRAAVGEPDRPVSVRTLRDLNNGWTRWWERHPFPVDEGDVWQEAQAKLRVYEGVSGMDPYPPDLESLEAAIRRDVEELNR